MFFGKLIQVDILPEMSLHIFRDIQDGLFIPVQMLLLLRIDGFKQKQSRQLVDPVGRPRKSGGIHRLLQFRQIAHTLGRTRNYANVPPEKLRRKKVSQVLLRAFPESDV